MALKEKVEDLERREIVSALREVGWMKSRAARRLGITERMLNYRIKKYGIEIRKEVALKEEMERLFNERKAAFK